MKKIQNILLLTIVLLSACNKSAVDSPPEDYKKIFGVTEIPEPDYDYDLMPILPCNPLEKADTYIYSGKEIKDKKPYIVTLKFWFVERELLGNDKAIVPNSDIHLKYVDKDKKLKILNTKSPSFLATPDFKNDEEFEIQFEAESGFPIFLGVDGAGYNSFEMRTSIEAVSKDGLIRTPKLEYKIKLRTDGYSDQFTNCETIILP